jgi:hypothetical protein
MLIAISTPLRHICIQSGAEHSLNNRGIFDPPAVHRLVALNSARKLDVTYSIFEMVCIEPWCRMFIDRPAPELL